MMQVKDYMTRRLITVQASTRIREVAKIFDTHPFDTIPVVDKEGNLIGIISRTDLLHAFLPNYFGLLDDFSFVKDFGALEVDKGAFKMIEKLFVADDLMTKKVITIEERESLLKAIAIMKKNRVKHLPVVRGGKLVGMITRGDILRAFLKEEVL
jgi:CBS domain-containing protein